MAVPQAIKDKNNGTASPETVAKACGTSQKSPKFFYLAGSSRDYGLTTGVEIRGISLTDPCKQHRDPVSAEQQNGRTTIKGFNSVKLFKDVFDHYGAALSREGVRQQHSFQEVFSLDESANMTSSAISIRKTAGIFRSRCSKLPAIS